MIIENKILNYKEEAGIGIICLDMKDYPTNLLNFETVPAILEAAGQAISNPDVKGIIITSQRKDFMAGADLQFIMALKDKEAVFKQIVDMDHRLLEMERSGKPIVAALNGSALGGGYEIALVCHHRIAVNSTATRIGLPEVNLGVLPGGGGTVRLPRMIGMEKALEYILQAKTFNPEAALQAGLVDELADDYEDVIARAKDWILKHPKSAQPWEDKRFKIPGGGVMTPKGAQTLSAGIALLRQKTRGNYPGAEYAMSAIYEGLLLPMERALVVEARYFVKAIFSKEARNIIRTEFFRIREAAKGAARPKDEQGLQINKVAILGAGMMGAGIAYVSAKAGLEVVLKDISEEAAEKGKDCSRQLCEKQIQRKRSTREKADMLLSKIKTTGRADDVKGSQIVIEAVFEQRELKARVTREAEAFMENEAVFASNTSTLPISGLSEASSRPKNFIGLHFFSPVDKMQLVEIIMGKQSSPHALTLCIDYVSRIGKVPIVVNDSRGFFTSRVFSTFTNEGMELLLEGVAPAMIENAALDAGMPVGPLAITDEINMELAYKIVKQTEEDLGIKDDRAFARVSKIFIEELDRPGKRQGKGFYEYPKGTKKYLWPGLKERFPLSSEIPSYGDIKKRILHIQALESVRCLEEGVLRSSVDGDIGSVLGIGFPIYTGGAFSYIDYVGLKTFIEECREFATLYGKRFDVPELLIKRVKEGKTFN